LGERTHSSDGMHRAKERMHKEIERMHSHLIYCLMNISMMSGQNVWRRMKVAEVGVNGAEQQSNVHEMRQPRTAEVVGDNARIALVIVIARRSSTRRQ